MADDECSPHIIKTAASDIFGTMLKKAASYHGSLYTPVAAESFRFSPRHARPEDMFSVPRWFSRSYCRR